MAAATARLARHTKYDGLGEVDFILAQKAGRTSASSSKSGSAAKGSEAGGGNESASGSNESEPIEICGRACDRRRDRRLSGYSYLTHPVAWFIEINTRLVEVSTSTSIHRRHRHLHRRHHYLHTSLR
jgi:hypothetical protein